MSPADGAFFGLAAEAPAALVPDLAIILPGGRTLLAISGLADALPPQGSCGDAPWQAVCWPVQNGRAGLALAASQPDGASRAPQRDGIPSASLRDSIPSASLRDDNYYSAALSLLVALADRSA